MPSVDDASMLESAILPSQWKDLFQSSGSSPEKRLMLAILLDAIQCWQGKGSDYYTNNHNQSEDYRKEMSRKQLALQNEAKAWLFEEIPILPWCLSVEDCCNTLDIDAATLRHVLQTGTSIKVRRMHVVTIGSQHRMYKRQRRVA